MAQSRKTRPSPGQGWKDTLRGWNTPRTWGMLVLGAFFGLAVAEWSLPDPPATSAEVLSAEELPNFFISSLEMAAARQGGTLGFTGWRYTSDSTLVLEFAPPSPARPVTMWQTLRPNERQQWFESVAATYTMIRISNGDTNIGGERGMAPIALTYKGIRGALAVQPRKGPIRIYRSPFDR
jgi:hypothetical protein